MQNEYIQIVPTAVSLTEQIVDYYTRNRQFLQEFAPIRTEEFFSFDYQEEALAREVLDFKAGKSYRFYIKLLEQPQKIIGVIALNNVVMGGFCSAFLSYKLDENYINQGYVTMAFGKTISTWLG